MKNWSRLISSSYEWEAAPETGPRSNALRSKVFPLGRPLGCGVFLLVENEAETALRGVGDHQSRTSGRGEGRRISPFRPAESLQIRSVRPGAERLIGPTPIHSWAL